MKKVKIGLVGFGTIGSGVYNLLKKNSSLISERTGLDISIAKICDIRLDQVKKEVHDVALTEKWEEVTGDKEIDIVVELIGGIEPARSILTSALKNGKSAVTANKKLLAETGFDIFQSAGGSRAKLGFEASVAGGVPSILTIRTGMVANNIKSIMGILNGTTNYILTKMAELGLPFDEALKEAQKKGFAEADPTFDIEGYDAGHKISILAMLAYNRRVDCKSLQIEGITKITPLDIAYARDMGYVIKLLGIARMVNGLLDIRVHPAMLPEKHPLASARNEFNAVLYDGDMTDPIILFGKGAGSLPTASAVVSDIVQLAEKSEIEERPFLITGDAVYLKPEQRRSKYYMRIHTEDSPGILSIISGVFGKFGISIASVIQKEVESEYVPLIIMTHEAAEDKIILARKEINNFDFISGDVTMIRVEESGIYGENNEQ